MATGTLYLDGDGDVWEETSPGTVVCRFESESGWTDDGAEGTFEYIHDVYGPMVRLVPSEAAKPDHVTRAQLAEAFTAMKVSVRYAEDFETGVIQSLDELAHMFREYE